MSKYPEGQIETKLGKVRWSWTQADHVHICQVEYLTLRGVDYQASSHLYLIDGTWQRKEPLYRDPYVSRKWTGKNVEPSTSARQALADLLLATWVEYAAAHPELGKIAERHKIGEEVEKLDEEIKKLEEELTAKKAERKKQVKALTALGGPIE